MKVNSRTEIKSSALNGRKIVIWTSLLTPILLLVSILFMGAGHGTYFFGKLFYPIPMIIAGFHGRVSNLSALLAVFQLPIYGLILFLFRNRRLKIVGLIMLLIHILLFLVAMILASSFD